MSEVFSIDTFSPDAVILAAGSYPSHKIPIDILRRAKYVCCCDSSAEEYIRRGLTPNAIVGDGDSLPSELKLRYKDILHIVSEQEDNDLTKATRHCIGHGFNSIAYIGATGKREDHTLGNISLMANYQRTFGLHPVMFTDHGFFLPSTGRIEVSTRVGQQISVFNLTAKSICSEGLRWPAYTFDELWQGTLNEATTDTVIIESDGVVLIFVNYNTDE